MFAITCCCLMGREVKEEGEQRVEGKVRERNRRKELRGRKGGKRGGWGREGKGEETRRGWRRQEGGEDSRAISAKVPVSQLVLTRRVSKIAALPP